MFQNNAEKLLESHLKFAHPIAGGSNNDNKPEKFPRPELQLDSSAEEWSEFLVPWNEYKAARLIKQLFASCSKDLRSKNYGRQSDW